MNIVVQLFQIITLQRRPSDLDYDQFATIFYVGMSIGLGYITNSLIKNFSHPLLYSLVQSLAQVAILYGILAVSQKSIRFVQTCTAIFGVSALLGCITLAISAIPGLGIINFFIMGWAFYMIVLIFKEALECSVGKAVLMTICLNMLAVIFLMLIFPDFTSEVESILNAASTRVES